MAEVTELQAAYLLTEGRELKKVKIKATEKILVDDKQRLRFRRSRELMFREGSKPSAPYSFLLDVQDSVPLYPYPSGTIEEYRAQSKSPIEINAADENEKTIVEQNAFLAEIADDGCDQAIRQSTKADSKAKYYDYMAIAIMGIVFILAVAVIIFIAAKVDFAEIYRNMGKMFTGGK